MSAPVESPLLTAAEACAYLRRSRTWMTEHAAEIGVIRDGGRLYFYRADLDAHLARRYVPSAAVRALPQAPARKRARPASPLTGVNPLTNLPWGQYDKGVGS